MCNIYSSINQGAIGIILSACNNPYGGMHMQVNKSLLFLRVLEIECVSEPARKEVLITNVACPNRFCFSECVGNFVRANGTPR